MGQPNKAPEQPKKMSVRETIVAMSAAVQQGDFVVAEALGSAAPLPLALPKAALLPMRTISNGAQACVYEAKLEDGLAVAVKRGIIRESQDLVRFRQEVVLLAEFAHPHIVELLGARMLPPEYSMVLGLEATTAETELHSKGWRPGWPAAVHLGAQLASALAHLHANNVVHRDIKPANVLLSANCHTSKLADLGIAVELCPTTDKDGSNDATAAAAKKPSGGFHKVHLVGTMEYMAPEVLLKHPHSFASDVFALAVAINEIASGQVPYSDCTRDNPLAHTILEMGYGRQELATAVAAEGLRPTLGPAAPPTLARLLRKCWDSVPERRPTAAELAALLSEIAKAMPWHSDNDVCVGDNNVQQQQQQQQKFTILTPDIALPEYSSNSNNEAPLETPSWVLACLEEQAGKLSEQVDSPTLNSNQNSAQNKTNDTPVVIGSFATAGARGEDRMEDRSVVIRDLFGLTGCHLIGVFDGHRGPETAEYLAANLERHVEARWSASTNAGALLKDVLVDADQHFRAGQDAEWATRQAQGFIADNTARPYPGSTATLALVIGSKVAVASVGDSAAVLCRNGEAVALTQDHAASREDERVRILSIGGVDAVRETEHGWRVGPSGLAVTRSIGDADVKALGVNAEADVTEFDLTPSDTFLIVATDGLWDKVDGQDAVELVHDTVKQPAMVAKRLVTEALARGSGDNTTAVVTIFPNNSTNSTNGAPERVYATGKGHKYSGGAVAAARRVAARLVEDEVRETY